jgi:2-aminoadipate transaminase
VAVATDGEGPVPQSLDETVRRLRAAGRVVKALYTIPAFHNPTGVTIPLTRREAIAEVLDEHGVLIVEDDAYGDLRFEGETVPSFLAITGGHGALRLGSYSKILATGLRVGYVAGRQDFVDYVTRIRYDLGLSPWLQRIVYEYAADGELERHIQEIIPVYRAKRDRMLAALDERCARLATWSKPEGGFYLWLKLADDIEGTRVPGTLVSEGLIAFQVANFYADRSGTQNVRLCYSTASLDEEIAAY